MVVPNKSLHAILLIGLCLLLSSACFDNIGSSVSRKDGVTSFTPTDTEVIKTERGYLKLGGWKIPPSSSFSSETKGVIKHITQEGDFLDVDYDLRKPSNELLTTEPEVILRDPKSLIRIVSMTELSFKGRLFACSFVAEEVKKNETIGKYIQEGPGIVYLYLDENGDGSFEMLKTDSSKLLIPSWVYK